MCQELYFDWHIGHASSHIKLVFLDIVKREKIHWLHIKLNAEYFWSWALRNNGFMYLLPCVLQKKRRYSVMPSNQNSFPIRSGIKIFYPRGFYHPKPHPQNLQKKRKNLILYRIPLLVFINDLRKHLDNMGKF